MTPAPLTIRPLGFGDLPRVMAAERRTFTSPWSLAMFVLELSKPTSVCLGAFRSASGVPESGEQVLGGYLICARYDTVWHLMNIAVDPDHRRQGIAWGLLGEMIERCGPDEPYTLEVRESNAPAIALYERLHFRAAGKRPRYYRDNGEDALIMWRTVETIAGSEAKIP